MGLTLRSVGEVSGGGDLGACFPRMSSVVPGGGGKACLKKRPCSLKQTGAAVFTQSTPYCREVRRGWTGRLGSERRDGWSVDGLPD